ncbi:DinB family protein [Brucella sp. 83/13]|nr:DinB family protein [Brucella sp. 83/13]
MEQHFQMFAYYNQWANKLLYDRAAQLSDEEYRLDLGLFFGSIHRTFNHLLVADRIWMKRFTNEGDHPKTSIRSFPTISSPCAKSGRRKMNASAALPTVSMRSGLPDATAIRR